MDRIRLTLPGMQREALLKLKKVAGEVRVFFETGVSLLPLVPPWVPVLRLLILPHEILPNSILLKRGRSCRLSYQLC